MERSLAGGDKWKTSVEVEICVLHDWAKGSIVVEVELRQAHSNGEQEQHCRASALPRRPASE